MRVRALFTGFELTKDKVYNVKSESETNYVIEGDDGKVYYRYKGFFEVVEE